jgi:uncharacterized phage protein (TIGR02218 family)
MPPINSALKEHLQTGLTTVAHAWAIERNDGVVLGFTDHDRDLHFDGIVFRADTGLSALSLAQSTGLSVDNSEAIGALSDVSIREDEIEQGRFDNARVKAWLVNWQDLSQRWLQFQGQIGEVMRGNGGFRAELRGLTDALNRPRGRVYQKPCGAVLGDSACGIDLTRPEFQFDVLATEIIDGRNFLLSGAGSYEDGWFARGQLEVLTGPGAGLSATIKQDSLEGVTRRVSLWEPIRSALAAETMVRLTAGCDKRSTTCRAKFDNYLNFRGFPDVPSEDWLLAVPKSGGVNTGGSRR